MSVRSYCLTTVNTPAASRLLTTLANVKAVLGITDGAQDTYLNLIIPQASAACENYCNRVFAQETLTDAFRLQYPWFPGFPDAHVAPLQLTRWPLVSVTSVIETDGQGVATTLTAGTDYESDMDAGQVFRLDTYGNPRNFATYRVAIQYVAGYALPGDVSPTMPADIEQAAIEMVKAMWAARKRDPNLRSETIPELISNTYQTVAPTSSGLPLIVESLLDNYRVPVVG